MEKQAKDMVLSLLWLGSLLWHRFDSWPWNFHMLQACPPPQKRLRNTVRGWERGAMILITFTEPFLLVEPCTERFMFTVSVKLCSSSMRHDYLK